MASDSSNTLVALLEDSARRFGPRPALIARRRYRTLRWSYAELWDATGWASAVLQAHGVLPGDRVVLWAPNDALWAIAFFGVLRLGAIVVPLDARSAPQFVAQVVDQTQPRLGLLVPPMRSTWPAAHVPCLLIDELPPQPGPPSLTIPSSPGHPSGSSASLAAEDLAEVIFTSGTTGDPKGVLLTHANIVANVRAVAKIVPPLPSDRALSLLPLSHMLEQTVGLLLPLSGGGSVVYPASRQPTEIFRALREHRATAMVVVPQIVALFLQGIEREVERAGKTRQYRWLVGAAQRLPMALRRLLFRRVHQRFGGRLRFIVCGGAYLEPELAQAWEALGVPIIQGYGTTEAAPVVAGTSIVERRLGSVGKPLPGQRVQIADDGEVLIAGPNVTSGYWRNPEATAAAFSNGWYCTGDLGEIDAAGYLYLRGRKKDMIVLASGLNVYAEDVERELRREPGVRDAAVLGIAAPGGGVLVHAVLLGPADAASAEAAVQRANDRLAEHQRVRGVSVWPGEDFPCTSTLKVKKHELQSWLQSGKALAAAPEADVAAGDLARLVARIAEVTVDRVIPQASLGGELGIDSLGRIELLAAIEAEMGAPVDEERVTETTTVADLERLVQEVGQVPRPRFPRWPLAGWCVALRTLLHGITFPVLRYRGNLRVEGLEHINSIPGLGSPTLVGVPQPHVASQPWRSRPDGPAEWQRLLAAPAIFAPNHSSQLDSPAVLAALPGRIRRRVAVAAAEDYFFARGWLGLAVSVFLNAFPFSRTGAVRPTLEWCGRLVDGGWSLLVFPEGTRSLNGEIAPFRSGIGLMALELGVPVVPVRVRGTYESLPKGQFWPRAGRISVSFGAPLRFPPGTSYEEAARGIEAAVRGL